MKKLLAICLAMGLFLVGCSSTDAPKEQEESKEKQTITVTVTDAKGEDIDVEFPANPQKVVALNWQTVDFLDAVGMGDRLVGIAKTGVYPKHLEKYALDDSIANVGGMKDIDMEAIMSLQPDVIFSSDRTEKMYDEFSKIAPTMAAYVKYSPSFMDGYKELAQKHGQIFGVEGEVDSIIKGYEERIANIAEFAEGKTALLGIFAGGINTLGNNGRASLVVNEMGFENLAGGDNVNHGNISSYEAWLDLNPDYMFILDKDSAVGTEAVSAKEQMEVNNPVIEKTNAYKNGNIVYLEPGDVWYIADGGITSLDLMIKCVEDAVGIK